MEDCKSAFPPSKTMQTQVIDMDGPYRLLYCSSKGDKAGVIQELDKGVDPNLFDYDKRTALHLASCEGWAEIAVLLLQKGADVNAVDCWGRTPLSDARGFCREDVCKILEARGGIDPVGFPSHTPCYEIDNTEVDMDHATLIGEEAYYEVYLVKWRGTEVAARTICSSVASNPRMKDNCLRELGIWQRLRHPNIVQFLGVLNHSVRLIFLTEYLRNGSLHDILKRKGRIDPITAVSYALDIARGMNYLHKHRPHAIIHRNLTPRNVLQDDSGHLKVTGFGLCKIAKEKDEAHSYRMTDGTGACQDLFLTESKTFIGSSKDLSSCNKLSFKLPDHYTAPEVYCREPYGKSVDVFSFAVMVHEMFHGRPSNRTELPEQVADKQAYEDHRPSLSSSVYPEPIKMLLRECWHKNPECRPPFEEIISNLEMIQEGLVHEKAMGVRCICI